jgi:DNA-binding NarL/FixJ family response regulator
MGPSLVRVLIAEDHELWSRFISTTLQKQPEIVIIGQVCDGLQAVQLARELQPDLILLDIGLPTINGIEAARRIREVSPAPKILFFSETRSLETAEEALNTGAGGYVLKSDAGRELLPGIKAVLEGKRFISASLAGHFLVATAVSTTQTTLLTSMVMLVSGIR